MALVPFGEYLPDLPAYQNPGATVALNVMPLTTKSYAPFSSLSTVTSAMPNRCQGGFGAKDYANVGYIFGGDFSHLYIWGMGFIDSFFSQGFFTPGFFVQTSSGILGWNDISNPSGYSIGNEGFWNFVQFGNRVIALGTNTNIQSYVLGTSTKFADLSAAAPQAQFGAVIRDFVMVGNTYDATDGSVPNKVWWPAIDDPTNWPTPGTNAAVLVQSDYQVLPEGGAIQGIIGAVGGADGAVFMEEAIYRVSYVGSPLIFQFDKIEKQKGTRIPGSVINVGPIAFYLGIDGFYAFDGTNSIPIGNEKIDKTFYRDFDQTYFYRMVSVVDSINKQVLWAYPGQGNNGGTPNKILVYNWTSNRWSIVEYEVETFFRSYSTGYTLEDLDNFGTLETLPYSLDSRFWAGGTVLLAGFDTEHKMGTFTGDTLAATLETGDYDGGNGQRMFTAGIRPIIDGGTITASVGHRDTLGGTINYTPTTSAGVDGICPQRISARYSRARINIAAGGSWTHAVGVEPVIQADGER